MNLPSQEKSSPRRLQYRQPPIPKQPSARQRPAVCKGHTADARRIALRPDANGVPISCDASPFSLIVMPCVYADQGCTFRRGGKYCEGAAEEGRKRGAPRRWWNWEARSEKALEGGGGRIAL